MTPREAKPILYARLGAPVRETKKFDEYVLANGQQLVSLNRPFPAKLFAEVRGGDWINNFGDYPFEASVR